MQESSKNKMRYALFLFSVYLVLTLGNVKAQTFYDPNTIQKIEVNFTQSNWDYMLDTSKTGADGYIMANWVKINGTTFDSVGVKYKGNSSYNATYSKNPLHIELDTYKPQNYQGYKDIKLSNGYADPSMIREVLAYDILNKYMHSPKSNFAKVYINGAYFGVYSNTENIGKKFYSDHFYSSDNTAIKCNPLLNPGPANKSNLKYITNDSSSYFNYYELKSNTGWNELVRLCDTVTNHGNRLENSVDIDKVIWMLAFNSSLVNLDSYSGAFCQNYYLYKDNNKRFNPIIWDLNMCFGGLPFVGSSNASLGSLSIPGLQQLPLSIHATDIHWPLINQIQSNAMFKRMYAAHARTIINEMIVSNYYQTRASTFQTLIDTSVLSDPYKFYSYTSFQNGMTANVSVGSYSVPGIATLMNSRNTYLQSLPEFTLTQPSISNIAYSPASPSISNTITVTASITNQSYTYLGYRDAPYEKFMKLQMFDDGLHGDGAASDGVFGQRFIATSPSMQYYIYAENADAGKFSPERAEYEFHTITINVPVVNKSELFINELMAKNDITASDENGEFEDWVELFNNTGSIINLGNVYLSNSATNLKKWRFPSNAYIQPYRIVNVWMDEDTTQVGYHANFKLSASGGSVFLSNVNNTILDSISFGAQSADISIRRCPDGTGNWGYTFSPTHNRLNCDVGIQELNNTDPSFILYPSPADQYISIINAESIQQISIYAADGKLIFTRNGLNVSSMTIQTSELPDGLYLINVNNKKSTKFIIQH